MRQLWSRPFEAFVAGLMLLVGFTQAFTPGVHPPEMVAILPPLVLRGYGLYVLIGSAAWLAGIAYGRLLWERAALTALAGALYAIALGETYLAVSNDYPTVGAEDLMETLIWQAGIGTAALVRATYISAVFRKAGK